MPMRQKRAGDGARKDEAVRGPEEETGTDVQKAHQDHPNSHRKHGASSPTTANRI